MGDGRANVYDPATNRWSNAGTTGRIAQTATRLTDGRILITGPGEEATSSGLISGTSRANRLAAGANLLNAVAPSVKRIASWRLPPSV